MSEGYRITSISGHGVDGTRFYWTGPEYKWGPDEIGRLPEATLFETREEAVADAVRDHQSRTPTPTPTDEPGA